MVCVHTPTCFLWTEWVQRPTHIPCPLISCGQGLLLPSCRTWTKNPSMENMASLPFFSSFTFNSASTSGSSARPGYTSEPNQSRTLKTSDGLVHHNHGLVQITVFVVLGHCFFPSGPWCPSLPLRSVQWPYLCLFFSQPRALTKGVEVFSSRVKVASLPHIGKTVCPETLHCAHQQHLHPAACCRVSPSIIATGTENKA